MNPGVQGPPGQKGQREGGTSGLPGTPGVMSYRNWKECAWKDLNDNKDDGLIRVNGSFVNLLRLHLLGIAIELCF